MIIKNQEKNILILVGRGKSTLTNWMMNLFENEDQPWINILFGVKALIKDQADIKKEVESGFKYIVHLQNKEDVKKIPLGIKRRALIFKIDF